MLAAIGLAILGSSVALHVEDSRGLSRADVDGLVHHLADAIGARTGEAPSLEAGGDDQVVLRVLGGATRIRVLASRNQTKLAIDLPRNRDAWAESMSGVASQLFPEPTPVAPAPIEAEPDHRSWFILGGAVAALGAGIGLLAWNQSSSPARSSLDATTFATGVGANVLISAAVVGGVAFTLLELSRDP